MKPATPLPWSIATAAHHVQLSAVSSGSALRTVEVLGFDRDANEKDTAYLAHAANAYPKLVEALRQAIAADPSQAKGDGHLSPAVALLRELGEEI